MRSFVLDIWFALWLMCLIGVFYLIVTSPDTEFCTSCSLLRMWKWKYA